MTMTDQQPPKKRGRPKGSKTTRKVSQSVEPTRCPLCQSTEYRRAWPIRNLKALGTTPNGKPYDRIVSSVKQCKNCDNEFIVNTWRYHGKVCEGDPIDPYDDDQREPIYDDQP